MNKLIVTLYLMLCVVAVSVGQDEENKSYISKGQWMAGGSISLYKRTDANNFSFGISPLGGYFFGKRIAAGLRAEHSYTKGGISTTPSTSHSFSVTPFARYYFGVNKVAPFAEVTYGANWFKYENASGSDKNSSTNYSGGVGLNYFIAPNVALEGVLRYSKTVDSYYDASLGFDLGLQFFFSRKNSEAQESDELYISKGQWLIGGSGNMSLGTLDEFDFNQFTINPMGGYFVDQKIAVGLSSGYNYYKGGTQSLFVGPFARYYFTQKKLAPFGEIAYGAAWTRIEYFDGSETVVEKSTGSSYRVAAGLNYFLMKNVALEGKLGYSRNPDINSGTVSFQVGLQFFLR